MKITVKVRPRQGKKAKDVVRDRVKSIQPECKVEEVFPDVKQGRRAGLVVVDLPSGSSGEATQAVLDALRGDEDVEYAEPAAPRKAKR